jgi:hypothetical protein
MLAFCAHCALGGQFEMILAMKSVLPEQLQKKEF